MRTALLGPVQEVRLLAPVTHETYELDRHALAGLALVKRFGLTDMWDREEVIRIVDRMGFVEGAEWLRTNRHLYFIALRELP
jgi:hypothetical protein